MIIIYNENDFANTFENFEDIDLLKKMIVMHGFATMLNCNYK